MNVASHELSEQLSKVSGWGYNGELRDDNLSWWYDNTFPDQEPDWRVQNLYEAAKVGVIKFPAYDLGYLRQAILDGINKKLSQIQTVTATDMGYGLTFNPEYTILLNRLMAALVSGEDATCKLAIELFKEGILIKELN
jgi:hypothetical protein